MDRAKRKNTHIKLRLTMDRNNPRLKSLPMAPCNTVNMEDWFCMLRYRLTSIITVIKVVTNDSTGVICLNNSGAIWVVGCTTIKS